MWDREYNHPRCGHLVLVTTGSRRRLRMRLVTGRWVVLCLVCAFATLPVERAGAGTVVSEFTVPTASSQPTAGTHAPDGNFWFTEQAGNKIARITPTGIITEFPIPTAN